MEMTREAQKSRWVEKKLFDEDRVFFYGLDVSSFTDPDSNEHARMSILSLSTKSTSSWKVK